MKVEEEQFEYVEKEVETYVCDRCGDYMGEEPDHQVVLNPRIRLEDYGGSLTTSRGSDREDAIVREMNEKKPKRLMDPDTSSSQEDNSFEWCSGCKQEVFGGSKTPDAVSEPPQNIDMGGFGIALVVLVILILLLLIFL